MARFLRRTAFLLAAIVLAPVMAAAADMPRPEPDAAAARFAVQRSQLQAQPSRDSIDGRFHLESRLQAATAAGQHGSGFKLQAKIVDAAATACVGVDALFANGFE